MFKRISEIVYGVIVCAIAIFGTVHLITGCGTIPPPPPGQRVLITDKANVRPEAFLVGQDGVVHAVPAPVNTLNGAIGDMVKQKFVGKDATLTSEEWLVPTLVPGSTEIFLDVGGIQDLLNPATSSLVTELAGKVLPAAAAPWVGPLAMFLPLLIPNFRKNGINAIQRVVPGVASPDSTETGTIPQVSDFQKAIVDLAKAITLHPPDPATVPVVAKPLNG